MASPCSITGGTDCVDGDRACEIAAAGLSVFLTPDTSARRTVRLLTQDVAGRPDRALLGALLLDEAEDQRRRGSSSPAKKIAASHRIA